MLFSSDIPPCILTLSSNGWSENHLLQWVWYEIQRFKLRAFSRSALRPWRRKRFSQATRVNHMCYNNGDVCFSFLSNLSLHYIQAFFYMLTTTVYLTTVVTRVKVRPRTLIRKVYQRFHPTATSILSAQYMSAWTKITGIFRIWYRSSPGQGDISREA
jgi:hypothetical protein